MAKETYYFSHDYNARNDKKIAGLVREFKSSGYGIFWATCEMMHEEGGTLEFDDLTIEAIAGDINEDSALVKEVLEQCVNKYKLFTKQDILLQSSRVCRNLETKNSKNAIKAESGRLGGIKSGESRRKENQTKQNEAVLHVASRNEPKEIKEIKEIKESKGNEMPGWEQEKISFLGSGDWIFKVCRDMNLTVDEFDAQAAEFLTQLNLAEDYKDVKELKRHFVNWYNKRKSKYGQYTTPNAGKKIEFDRP